MSAPPAVPEPQEETAPMACPHDPRPPSGDADEETGAPLSFLAREYRAYRRAARGLRAAAADLSTESPARSHLLRHADLLEQAANKEKR
jgi:hypothetical protein